MNNARGSGIFGSLFSHNFGNFHQKNLKIQIKSRPAREIYLYYKII